MKTILHVIDTTGPGGAETVFIDLADRLRGMGYRSIPVIRGPGWVHDTLLARGLEPVVIDAKGSFNLPFLRRLVELIRKERVDLIQSHLLGSNVYCSLAGWLTGTPVVATFHGMVDISPTERFRRAKLWVMEKGSRRFVAVSSNLASAVARERLLNPEKTSVIYNGIDLSKYGGAPAGELRRELGLPPTARIALSIGNVRPAKGYHVLIKAASLLLQRWPELHFVIAGHIKESLMAQLRQQMADCAVASNMHFVGFRNDTPALLSEADLFVLSSTSEGFSISTIEALAGAVPVVATRCGGPEEIVTADVDALLVNTDDALALAQAIEAVLLDPASAQARVAAGLENVQARFAVQAMLSQYEAIYRAAWHGEASAQPVHELHG